VRPWCSPRSQTFLTDMILRLRSSAAGDCRGSSSVTLADTTAVLRCNITLGGMEMGGGGSTAAESVDSVDDFSRLGTDARFAS